MSITLSDIPFATVDGQALSLDLYLPDTPHGLRPLIVWIHGGAWLFGDKAHCPEVIAGMTASGYAVASINYRFSTQAIFPAQLEDCKAAVRFVRAHAEEYQLDPAHIGAAGDSAGGHLAAMLGVSGATSTFDRGKYLDYPSAVQAVADFFGPADLPNMHFAESQMQHNAPDSPESQLIGGTLPECPELARAASPMHYVHSDCPPFFIIHGDCDTLVSVQQSVTLHQALIAAGVEATLRIVPGAGHDFNGVNDQGLLEAFFDKHLKQG